MSHPRENENESGPAGEALESGDEVPVDAPVGDELHAESDAGLDPEDKVSALEKECEQLREKNLRAKADFVNYQKRMRRELEDARKYAITDFARQLLEVVDNLERALSSTTESEVGLREGVELTREQLLGALKKNDVIAMDAEGQPFDPNRHEAVLQEERDDLPAGTVTAELVRGYEIADRVLRPAMVRISQGGPERPPHSKEDQADE